MTHLCLPLHQNALLNAFSAAREFSSTGLMAMKLHRVINISFIILAINPIRIAESAFLNCKDCGGVFTKRQSVITSPNYPQYYPPNACCVYTIRSSYRCPVEYHIQLLDFLLELSLNCTNDFMEIGNDKVLCGHVTGIRKYRTEDGILRIRFVSNGIIEERGFRLLITRLSCEDTMAGNNTYPNYMVPHVEEAINNSRTSSSQLVLTRPTLDLLPPLLGDRNHLSKQTNQGLVFQAKLYLPPSNNPSYTLYPTPTPTDNGYLPPGSQRHYQCLPSAPNYLNYPQNNILPKPLTIGSCCAGNFRQQRFYLTSPDFPNRISGGPPRDCFYYIEKSGPNVCRLRVAFRFFALGSVDSFSGHCLSDFIEIDDERICGCQTGFVLNREWGLGMKVIRLKSNGGLSGTPSIGFILDITQVDCGIRYSRQVTGGDIVETNKTSSTRTRIYRYDDNRQENWEVSRPGNDMISSKLFFPATDPCVFGFADLLRISFDPLWLTRQGC